MELLSGLKMIEHSFMLSYIDAGTGSLLIQILIGSLAGGLLVLRMVWKKLVKIVKRDHTPEKLEKSQEHLVEH